MSIVGKVQVPGEQNPALITSTLFGRCTTAANDSHKVVTIANDAFSENFLMDGMSLKVFFENGNICDAPDLTIKTSGGTVLVQAIPIRGFHLYIGEDHTKDMVDCNYATMTWTDGGVISFTYMRRDPANAGTNGFTYGDYWLIDNQALDSNYAYGYQSNDPNYQADTYFIDAQYGVWNHSETPATLTLSGYWNPNIKSGRYIYSFCGGHGVSPWRDNRQSGDVLIQGILEVIHCDTQTGDSQQNNYVIETFTFFDEPESAYRRMWAEPSSSLDWHNMQGWSNWYQIKSGAQVDSIDFKYGWTPTEATSGWESVYTFTCPTSGTIHLGYIVYDVTNHDGHHDVGFKITIDNTQIFKAQATNGDPTDSGVENPANYSVSAGSVITMSRYATADGGRVDIILSGYFKP